MKCANPTVKYDPQVAYIKPPEPVDCGGEMEEKGGIEIENDSGHPILYKQKLYQCKSCKDIKIV